MNGSSQLPGTDALFSSAQTQIRTSTPRLLLLLLLLLKYIQIAGLEMSVTSSRLSFRILKKKRLTAGALAAKTLPTSSIIRSDLEKEKKMRGEISSRAESRAEQKERKNTIPIRWNWIEKATEDEDEDDDDRIYFSVTIRLFGHVFQLYTMIYIYPSSTSIYRLLPVPVKIKDDEEGREGGFEPFYSLILYTAQRLLYKEILNIE